MPSTRKQTITCSTYQLSVFTRQLATLLKADVSVKESVKMAAASLGHSPQAKKIQDQLQSNPSFVSVSGFLEQHQPFFPRYLIEISKAGEQQDKLVPLLQYFSKTGKKIHDILITNQRLLYAHLSYSLAILAILVVIGYIFLFYVIPTFVSMFDEYGSELPAITQLVIQVSVFLEGLQWYLFASVVLFFLLLQRQMKRMSESSYFPSRFIMAIPLLGSLFKLLAALKITQILSTLLTAGIPLSTALTLSAQFFKSRAYRRHVDNMLEQLKRGKPFSEALDNSGFFDQEFIQEIRVCERSHCIDQGLTEMNTVFESSFENKVLLASQFLKTGLLMLAGMIVGTFVIAMYLPIFKMGSIV